MSPGQFQWCCSGPFASAIYISGFDINTQVPYIVSIDQNGVWRFIQLPGGAAGSRNIDLSLGTDGGCWAVVTQGGLEKAHHLAKDGIYPDKTITLQRYMGYSWIESRAYKDNTTSPLQVWTYTSGANMAVYLKLPGGVQETISPLGTPDAYIHSVDVDENGVVYIYFIRSKGQSGSTPTTGDVLRATRHLDGTYTIDTLFHGVMGWINGRYYGSYGIAWDSAAKGGFNKCALELVRYSTSGDKADAFDYLTTYPDEGWHKDIVRSGSSQVSTKIDIDNQGHVHVVWWNNSMSTYGPLYYTSSANGWQDIVLAPRMRPDTSTGGGGYCSADIAVTSAGKVMAAWYDEDWSITVAVKQPDNTWQYFKSSDYMTERVLGAQINIVAN